MQRPWQQAASPVPWAPCVHFSVGLKSMHAAWRCARVGTMQRAAAGAHTTHRAHTTDRPAQALRQRTRAAEGRKGVCMLVGLARRPAFDSAYYTTVSLSLCMLWCVLEKFALHKCASATAADAEGGGWTWCRVPGHSKIVWEWSGCSKQWSALRNATRMQPHHRWDNYHLPAQSPPHRKVSEFNSKISAPNSGVSDCHWKIWNRCYKLFLLPLNAIIIWDWCLFYGFNAFAGVVHIIKSHYQ